jgi:hypothetical protein
MRPLLFAAGLSLLALSSACKRSSTSAEGAGTQANASTSASATTSSATASNASASGSAPSASSESSAPVPPFPPRPTEPPVLGAESYFAGSHAADAIADLRARNGGALRLLDMHLYPGRIVLKAQDPKGDAIDRWEIRPSGVIGPKPEGLSAKKLDKRLFDHADVPLAKLATMCADAITKSGLAGGAVTLVDVRRGKTGGVAMRFAVHANGTTRWIDVDVAK